jgi:hypothetical protein
MDRTFERLSRLPRDRVAALVSAGAYGSVLVLGAVAVISVSDVAKGHGAELVAGVGVATWVAHLFAEVLGDHVERVEPLRRHEVVQDMVDGVPILAATVLPAFALLLGRLDVLSASAARVLAIVVTVVQLLGIGAFVGRLTPARTHATWIFAGVTAGIGLAVVLLTVTLGH